jgi:hypothetical protein
VTLASGVNVYPDEDVIASPRLLWYNPKLDPALSHKMTPKMIDAINDGTYDDGSAEQGGPLNTPDECHPANLVSSLCEDGLHRPALDIDISYEPAHVRCIHDGLTRLRPLTVVASAGGNCHAYCTGPAMIWSDYVNLLLGLGAVGWLEDRYVAHSINREQTLLRLPGISKLVSDPCNL